jgi:hypothetical protein
MEETDLQHPKYPLPPLNIENSIYIYKLGSWVLGVLGGLEPLEPKKPRPPLEGKAGGSERVAGQPLSVEK